MKKKKFIDPIDSPLISSNMNDKKNVETDNQNTLVSGKEEKEEGWRASGSVEPDVSVAEDAGQLFQNTELTCPSDNKQEPGVEFIRHEKRKD